MLGEISLAGRFKSRTPFFLNNSRLYELGAMDGAFLPMGRLLGDRERHLDATSEGAGRFRIHAAERRPAGVAAR